MGQFLIKILNKMGWNDVNGSYKLRFRLLTHSVAVNEKNLKNDIKIEVLRCNRSSFYQYEKKTKLKCRAKNRGTRTKKRHRVPYYQKLMWEGKVAMK